MRITAILAALFLATFVAGLSEASANQNRRTSFFQEHMAYEFGAPETDDQRRPAYMPHEFGVRVERQPIVIPAWARQPGTAAPAPAPQIADDGFVPFEYARARNIAQPQVVHSPEIETADGFVPFDYARARFADTPQPAAPAPVVVPVAQPTEIGDDGFMPFDYARARFAN